MTRAARTRIGSVQGPVGTCGVKNRVLHPGVRFMNLNLTLLLLLTCL